MPDNQPTAGEARCLRRTGLYVLLYAFCHAYFGVGSLKNALGGTAAAGRAFAFLFGASWLALWTGGALLLAGRNVGRIIAKTGAFFSSLSYLIGFAVLGFSLNGKNGIFIVAQPLSGLALFFLITVMTVFTPTLNKALRRSIVAAALLLPWSLALILMITGSLPALPPGGISLFRGLFLSFWCALPFVSLLAAVDCMPGDGRTLLAGGLAGTALASIYTYGLIWTQSFNVFLLALLPPVVFTAQASGIFIGMLRGKLFRGKAG